MSAAKNHHCCRSPGAAMIYYQNGGIHSLLNVFRVKGSVYKIAGAAAVPNCVLCVILRVVVTHWDVNADRWFLQQHGLWASFSSLLGFLVVFRTSQAYARFWSGCTSLHRVKAEWFDACSALLAFCKFSDASSKDTTNFQVLIVRLFSVLYTLALADIEDMTEGAGTARAFDYELVGAQEMDHRAIHSIKSCDAKVELVYQWIQQLIVENISKPDQKKVLNIPPPILSRVFQQLGNGMAAFHEAVQIASIPFPFPYSQCCSCLLAIHWLLIPFVVCGWSPSLWIAGTFSFLQVFILWALNSIAIEIENPFGTDSNDVDGRALQIQMNRHLEILLETGTLRTPMLAEEGRWIQGSMTSMWAEMPDEIPVRVEEDDTQDVQALEQTTLSDARFSTPLSRCSLEANVREEPCKEGVPQKPSEGVNITECNSKASDKVVIMNQEWRQRPSKCQEREWTLSNGRPDSRSSSKLSHISVRSKSLAMAQRLIPHASTGSSARTVAAAALVGPAVDQESVAGRLPAGQSDRAAGDAPPHGVGTSEQAGVGGTSPCGSGQGDRAGVRRVVIPDLDDDVGADGRSNQLLSLPVLEPTGWAIPT